MCRSGLLAGFYGFLDPIVSRLTDTLLAFPFLVLAVGLAAILGPSLLHRDVAIGIAGVPAVIRVTRSETLRLRGLDFVAAAVADGASDLVVLRRHILPNAVNTLIVQATVAAPARDHRRGGAVVPRPGHPAAGAVARASCWPAPSRCSGTARGWRSCPACASWSSRSALNLLGDGLRDALDPRETRDERP